MRNGRYPDDWKPMSSVGAGVREIRLREAFESVWDAIEDTPAEAENMKIRSQMMMNLKDHIQAHDLSQAEAA